MYAITATSYRSIASASDLRAGESAAADIPTSTLNSIASAEARAQRDAFLRACDWTVAADAPLTSAKVVAWKTYRQSLRDVPAQAKFPQSIAWPSPPSAGSL